MLRTMVTVFFLIVLENVVLAQNNVLISRNENKLCIASNSLPDHDVGKFPNRGNPHTMREQNVEFCVPINPVKNEKFKFIKGTLGIAINGIQFRPNTAGYYDPLAKSGHSRNGDKRFARRV